MPTSPLTASPDGLLDDLNDAQREAVLATTGPVAILAAAGTGKTRVVTRRTAYAIATGVVPADQALVVTFTDKAANEMAERLRGLGLPGVTARTFHAHALSQIRHFWPSRHDGAPLPQVLDSKLPILVRLIRELRPPHRFTPAKDLADEIEWAKSRRIGPADYERRAAGRTPPVPVDLFVRVFGEYERAKARANRLDFDDMLALTVDLLETDEDAAATVRARKRWFSVDEYQDTNPLQERLLELWAGASRDVCVVGDEDQTIYTFAGATSAFLTGFAERHPGARVIALSENYRSTPQVLELANRLLASDGRPKRLAATLPDGPAPVLGGHPTAEAELATLTARVRGLIADGIAPAEIVVIVRMNAQLAALEAALTRAGVAYQVRGLRFYERQEVRAAIDVVRRAAPPGSGQAVRTAVLRLWRDELGYEEDGQPEGAEARERAASLDTLLDILDELVRAAPTADVGTYLDDLAARAAHEREASADGVVLSTYHRAKGLEWDAVFLPMLEEGSLPVGQAADDDEALGEERRLLYVGITRARRFLFLSWAELRETRGRETRRRPSRFLDQVRARQPRPARRIVELPDAFAAPAPRRRAGEDGDPVFAALREWRAERAREDAVPAYVVAHDQTLAAIAEARPATLPQLRRVRGMGPAKLERYGSDILAILARFGENH